MFSMRVFRPVLSSIALCCLLIIAPIVTWAQAQSHSSSFDTAFLSGDPLRVIAEPLFYGEKSFIQRLSIKTQGSREPLALVLCGGSARAYAHIGVLKVLERAGIQPDFIVANSMGAIVGVLYAAGFSPDDIELLVRSLPPEHYLDIVFPARGGFIDMNRFIAMLDMLTGSMDLSETHIPIIITGEDLKSRRQIWFAEGRLSRILAGAIAMPAIFEPQPVGNYLIVDGGSATIVPLEPALRFTQSIVVSTAFYNRIMNFSNPLTVINRAFDIGKTRTGIEALANSNAFVIRNRVEDLSYMQFSNP
ncbi:MAG: patatin-like phospholipase family protein, partial [Rectinema sp.]|nr:patatin-like phospholipase family protein [Rectinema sp.]